MLYEVFLDELCICLVQRPKHVAHYFKKKRNFYTNEISATELKKRVWFHYLNTHEWFYLFFIFLFLFAFVVGAEI